MVSYRGDEKLNNNNRKYKVITLCGSIKYKDIFLYANSKGKNISYLE